MKAIAVVGTKKTGKTTLVEALVRSLAEHGRVGTVKSMLHHSVDRGDTKRHYDAGADVVIGLGDARLVIRRERETWSLPWQSWRGRGWTMQWWRASRTATFPRSSWGI